MRTGLSPPPHGGRGTVWSATPPRDRAGVLITGAAINSAKTAIRAGRPGRCTNAANPGPRRTGTWPRPSTSAFYAREMIRLAEPRRWDLPGEKQFYRAHPHAEWPWSSLLEFSAGDPLRHDLAALVAGNSVIMKPAERLP